MRARCLIQVAALCLTFAAAVWPSRASAQDQDTDARMHFRLGRVYYNNGRFEDAAQEFRRSYELSHRTDLLYNVFVSWRAAGRIGHAIAALREYIPTLGPDDRPRFEAQLRILQRNYHAQHHGGETTRGGGGTANGGAGGATHATGSGTTGAPASRASSGARSGASGSGGHGAHAAPSTGPGIGPWLVMGGGGVLLAGSLVTGLLALSSQSQLDKQCDASRACAPGFESTQSRGLTFATISDVLLIGGGLAVAGGLLWLVLGGHGSSERAPAIALACAPGGCAATGRITF